MAPDFESIQKTIEELDKTLEKTKALRLYLMQQYELALELEKAQQIEQQELELKLEQDKKEKQEELPLI